MGFGLRGLAAVDFGADAFAGIIVVVVGGGGFLLGELFAE